MFFGIDAPLNTNGFPILAVHSNRQGRFRSVPPSNRRFLTWSARSGRKGEIPTPGTAEKSNFPRLMRTDYRFSRAIWTARVDLGRSSLHFAHFSHGLAVPGEKVHFHTSETQKLRVFECFRNFRATARSCNATDQSRACKIRIFFRLLQLFIQLRGSGPWPKFRMICMLLMYFWRVRDIECQKSVSKCWSNRVSLQMRSQGTTSEQYLKIF